ncbi:hypothetical protein B7P34_00550 [Streptosporangium nondiastaticum]|uniref:Uncharacterized protein n=1 Tax=Streptosporangium nondiastaticum TaxID=35764 RepID=A0A9X7JVJ0_9ACTN|nr:hypothetical protein B7P34_00550 [Streptosporangium nondiastaticum]
MACILVLGAASGEVARNVEDLDPLQNRSRDLFVQDPRDGIAHCDGGLFTERVQPGLGIRELGDVVLGRAVVRILHEFAGQLPVLADLPDTLDRFPRGRSRWDR